MWEWDRSTYMQAKQQMAKYSVSQTAKQPLETDDSCTGYCTVLLSVLLSGNLCSKLQSHKSRAREIPSPPF